MQAEHRATLATEQAQDSAGGSVPAERAQASWRGTLKIHPACELIPPMSADEVRDLGENILKNGLISPIALWLASKNAQAQLLDGRSRLDALELALGRPVRVTSRTFRGRTTWSLEADDDAGESVVVGVTSPVVINEDHALVQRALERPADPELFAWLLLAVYAEINAVLEAVLNTHELAFQQRVVEALLAGELR